MRREPRVQVAGTALATTDPAPTRTQVEQTKAIVRWYLRLYHRTPWDRGTAATFCDPAQVGDFAVAPEALAAGDDMSLFRLLVCVTMFQRRQDVQILRILRGIPATAARELSDSRALLRLVDRQRCPNLKTQTRLRLACDLAKDVVTRRGTCEAHPSNDCHLKTHTVLLKRYGHFGKMPTSAALMLRENSVASLGVLLSAISNVTPDRGERAARLVIALSGIWRVSEKIANMFLSLVSNPDVTTAPPWADALDWTQFVVIDSNVDLFLGALAYKGSRSYEARRRFVRAVAERIDLAKYDSRVRSFNPRVVQQAMYLFMSRANRRDSPIDCVHLGERACRKCPIGLRSVCPVRT